MLIYKTSKYRFQTRTIIIEEGRAANKSPHYTFGYFLSTSQQEVFADIIQNSAVGNFSPKTEGTKTKTAFFCARNQRPSFRKNKLKTLVFND
jgi:hypothetical protein